MDNNLVIEGLNKAKETIKNIQVSCDKNGVGVTISAEPRVLRIVLPESVVNGTELANDLVDCLNKAINDSKVKVVEQITQNLNPNSVKA